MLQLSGLFVYPVKSARGIALREAQLTERGIRHDRRFMLVDEQGRFVTQRELPQLARLEVALDDEQSPQDRACDGELVLTFAGERMHVPLYPRHGVARRVRVFLDDVDALDLGAPVRDFLTAALGRTCSLVYMPDDSRRQVDPTRASEHDVVGFADGFPYLLASESSLEALNRELAEPVPMTRFRPNLVVSGMPAYAEDTLTELTVGEVRFLGLKPCSRCVIVNTDQASGQRSKGVLEALVRTHVIGKRPMFGQNLVARGSGRLRLGDPVYVGPT